MKKKAEHVVISPKEFGGYELYSHDKLDRVFNGVTGEHGLLTGGIGKDAPLEQILAEYDKLGGLIKKDGLKLATGSFYDFRNKKAREIPSLEKAHESNSKGLQINTENVGAVPKKGRESKHVEEE